jgi:hypothetical protein
LCPPPGPSVLANLTWEGLSQRLERKQWISYVNEEAHVLILGPHYLGNDRNKFRAAKKLEQDDRSSISPEVSELIDGGKPFLVRLQDDLNL